MFKDFLMNFFCFFGFIFWEGIRALWSVNIWNWEQLQYVIYIYNFSCFCDFRKPKNFFFLVFLVKFQVYFTEFLKVYATVLLLKKYLTSKIEKKNIPHGFFKFHEPPDLGKKIFTTWNVLKSKVYLTCINFWKFHDDLKACLKVIWLTSWPKNVKFSVKMQFFTFLTPWKSCFWINDKYEI